MENFTLNDEAFSSPQLIINYILLGIVFILSSYFVIKGYMEDKENFLETSKILFYIPPFIFVYTTQVFIFGVLNENNFQKGCLNFTISHLLIFFLVLFSVGFFSISEYTDGKHKWKLRYAATLNSYDVYDSSVKFFKVICILLSVGNIPIYFSNFFLFSCDETTDIQLYIYISTALFALCFTSWLVNSRKMFVVLNGGDQYVFILFVFLSTTIFLNSCLTLLCFLLLKIDLLTLELCYTVQLFLPLIYIGFFSLVSYFALTYPDSALKVDVKTKLTSFCNGLVEFKWKYAERNTKQKANYNWLKD